MFYLVRIDRATLKQCTQLYEYLVDSNDGDRRRDGTFFANNVDRSACEKKHTRNKTVGFTLLCFVRNINDTIIDYN